MRQITWRLAGGLLALALSACAGQPVQVAAPTAPERPATAPVPVAAGQAPAATLAASQAPAATGQPAAQLRAAATPTAAMQPTPDPYAAYAAYTIDGLRARSYGGGQIQVLHLLSQTASFSR